MRRSCSILGLLLVVSTASVAADDATRGAQAFRDCTGCHSLNAGDHRTGPSLAFVYGRRAGTADGFQRYSAALRKSGIVWDDKTLDAWLRDPAALVPGTAMGFRGVPDPQARGDLVAFLRAVSEGKAPGAASMTPPLPDLKKVEPGQQVTAIRKCGDSYFVTLRDSKTYAFWEFNLRFKSDSSRQGPARGQPVILSSGMGGDRAQVVFAEPAEISAFVRTSCK